MAEDPYSFVDGVPPGYLQLSFFAGFIIFLMSGPWSGYTSWINVSGHPGMATLLSTTFALALIAPAAALRHPLAAVVVVLGPALVTFASEGEVPVDFLLIAFFWVIVMAFWHSPVQAAIIAVLLELSAVLVISGLVPLRDIDGTRRGHASSILEGAATSVLFAAPVLLALWFGRSNRRKALEELEVRELAERREEVEEQSAVVAERARLARELHDVIAHHVSLIAVRAETAPYTEADLGAGGREVLAELGSEARLALDELRSVLGVLARSSEEAERAPAPGLADIRTLIERARQTGQDVEVSGDLGQSLGTAAGHATYRVVQETITNVRRHAPGQTLHVEIGDDDPFTIVCWNRMVPGVQATGSRHGLIGMRERVTALGGRLASKVVDDRFVVHVSLPRGIR